MPFGVPGLRKTLIGVALVALAGVWLISCGSVNSNTTTGNQPSRLKFRAFVSNPVQPLGTSNFPVLNIVNARLDQLSGSIVSLASSVTDPNLIAVAPNMQHTLVYSGADASLALVTNSTESVTANSTAIRLPGTSESMLIDPFSTKAYVAVPSAPVTGQLPGEVVVIDLSTFSISASIPVAGVRYLVQSHDGNSILAFSDGSNSVTLISPILIGSGTDPRTVLSGFDRPVWGVFSSDDSTAYILNCGPQCGGTAASVSLLGMPGASPGPSIPVDGATIGLLQGATLYVAGTPPGADCGGSSTAATVCGRLDVVDTGSMTVTGSAVISDGYHRRIAMGANGQLFVGARTCTNINTSDESRGCLSIFNTNNGKVVIPPATGDVTAIQPITNRSVVYVCQNGALSIYDTTTDARQSQQVNIIGQAMDVKLADGPP
jgi:hypothetical protein